MELTRNGLGRSAGNSGGREMPSQARLSKNASYVICPGPSESSGSGPVCEWRKDESSGCERNQLAETQEEAA